MNETQVATLGAGYCPDCGHAGFRLGPKGGAAQNIECMGCRQSFNVTTFGWHVVMAQRLDRTLDERTARYLYRNDAAPTRNCDHCGGSYRGPAVYCSLECAEADAS